MPLVSKGRANLSEKQSQAWHELDDPEVSEVFLGGGAGFGKSAFGNLWQVHRRIIYPKTRGFIGRENWPALRDSTLKTLFEVTEGLRYRSGIDFNYNAQEHTIFWSNDSETHLRHMQYMPSDPDYNRFGSTEYTDGFVDEAPETDPRACQILLSRMRHRHAEFGITPKLLYTGNPGRHWIRYQFVLDEEDRPVVLPKHRRLILATIADHPDKEYRAAYMRTLSHLDHYDQQRLLYGDWSVNPNILRPFAFQFNRNKHIAPCEYDPKKRVIVSVDFNRDPFCCIFAQVWDDGATHHCHIFGEESIREATLTEMANRIRARVVSPLMIEMTGDRNGMDSRLNLKSNASMFDDLLNLLGMHSRQLTIQANPSHIQSREDSNYVLANHPDLKIDPSCTGLIRDLQNVEVDEDGQILKANRAIVTQQADLLDAFRYLTNSFLWDFIKAHKRAVSFRSQVR